MRNVKQLQAAMSCITRASNWIYVAVVIIYQINLSCAANATEATPAELKFSNLTDDFDLKWLSSNPTHNAPNLDTNTIKQQDGNNNFNLGGFERHPCRRICLEGQSLTCYYKLVTHNYQRLGAECNRCLSDEKACAAEHCIYGDGVPTPVMAVNGMVPGPPIELCENDTLIVDVINQLTEPTAIHWHGLSMSETPDMDGAPFVTQYPIQPGEGYRYSFRADRSGTVWYHSHQSLQRAFGLAGNFVIRQQHQLNRHARLYDYDMIEHTLMIGDIVYGLDFSRIANILINGKGRNFLNSLPDNDPRHRYERLRITPGYRYRMRVVSNGVFNCPIEFSIEQHRLLIISTDGNDIEPVLADSFFMGSAERFDFVLDADQYPDNYWIRVRGYNNCSMYNLYQGAVLHYRGAARYVSPERVMEVAEFGRTKHKHSKPVLVNMLDEFKRSSDAAPTRRKESIDIATVGLKALTPLPWPRYTKFLTYYSSFGARTEPNGSVNFQIDDITYASPSLSLLQTRHLFDESSYFCNSSSLLNAGQNCIRDNCECTNVLRLPAYEPIELVVANYLEDTHPFHTHGYTFRLVGQGVIGNVKDLRRISDLDRRGILKRTPPDYAAVEKDTIQIPGLGYIIVRFISDNPGFWLYHCHIELHAVAGMAAVLKVGENYEMKSTPPKLHC